MRFDFSQRCKMDRRAHLESQCAICGLGPTRARAPNRRGRQEDRSWLVGMTLVLMVGRVAAY